METLLKRVFVFGACTIGVLGFIAFLIYLLNRNKLDDAGSMAGDGGGWGLDLRDLS